MEEGVDGVEGDGHVVLFFAVQLQVVDEVEDGLLAEKGPGVVQPVFRQHLKIITCNHTPTILDSKPDPSKII